MNRCYATIADFFEHLLGVKIGIFEPLQTFGFFMGLAFAVGAIILRWQLKQKEAKNFFKPQIVEVAIGKPATVTQIVSNALFGFVAGYKMIYGLLNFSACKADAASFILSLQGNWLGGIFFAVAFGFFKYWEKNKEKLPKPKIEKQKIFPSSLLLNIVVIAAIGGILGGKIFTFFETPNSWEKFLANPSDMLFSMAGLTIYGGLIGGASCVIYYLVKKKINLWHFADAVAPALIAGYGVGRMGCELSGDGDWGIPVRTEKPNLLSWLPDRFWKFDYPFNVNKDCAPYDAYYTDNPGLGPECKWTEVQALVEPVFPTPIYEIFMCLIIFGILIWVGKKFLIPGVVMATYLVLNGVERFLIERIRVNPRFDLGIFELNQAEIISPIFVIGGVALAYFAWRKWKRKTIT